MPSQWGEGSERLLERVLEAQVTQGDSELQGISLKKREREGERERKREKEKARHGDQSSDGAEGF